MQNVEPKDLKDPQLCDMCRPRPFQVKVKKQITNHFQRIDFKFVAYVFDILVSRLAG